MNQYRFGKIVVCGYCIRSHTAECYQCKARTLMSDLYHVTTTVNLDAHPSGYGHITEYQYTYDTLCITCVHKWIDVGHRTTGHLVTARIGNTTAEKFISRIQKKKSPKPTQSTVTQKDHDQLKEELAACKQQLEDHLASHCTPIDHPTTHLTTERPEDSIPPQQKPPLSEETDRKLRVIAQMGYASIITVNKVIDTEYEKIVGNIKAKLVHMKATCEQFSDLHELSGFTTVYPTAFMDLVEKMRVEIKQYEQLIDGL
jgi:hypothetical protein